MASCPSSHRQALHQQAPHPGRTLPLAGMKLRSSAPQSALGGWKQNEPTGMIKPSSWSCSAHHLLNSR